MDGWGALDGRRPAVCGLPRWRWGVDRVVRVTGWMVWMRGLDMGGVLEALWEACGGRQSRARGWGFLVWMDEALRGRRAKIGAWARLSPHGGGAITFEW